MPIDFHGHDDLFYRHEQMTQKIDIFFAWAYTGVMHGLRSSRLVKLRPIEAGLSDQPCMLKIVVPTLILLLISACSTNEQKTTLSSDEARMPAGNVLPTEPEVIYRKFEQDTLYDLLLAETAIQRQQYDTAYQLYEKQAKLTKDGEVLARATRLALSLGKSKQHGELTRLWYEADPNNTDSQRQYLDHLIASKELDRAWRLAMKLDNEGSREQTTGIFADIAYSLVNDQTKSDELVSDRSTLLAKVEKHLLSKPNDSDALLGLSFIRESQGDVEKALGFAKKAYRTNDSLLRAGYQIMRMQYAEKDYPAIKNTLIRLVNDHPGNAPLRESLARTFYDEKEFDKASFHYKTLLVTKSEDPSIRFRLGLALFNDNKLNEAKRQFEELIRQQQIIDRSYFQLAAIAKTQGNYKQAYAYLDRLTEPQFRTAVLNERVKLLLEQERDAEAIEKIESLRKQISQEFSNKRKQANTSSDIFKEGDEAKQQVAQLTQELEALFMLEADTVIDSLSYAEAHERVDRGIDLIPDSIALYYKRSMLFTEQQEIDKAIDSLEQAHKKFPKNPDIANALGYTLADENRELARAKKLIEYALTSDPDSYAFLDSLGWAEYRLGNYQRAYELLKRAFEGFQDPEVGAHYAAALWKLGNKKEARSVLRQMIKQADEGRNHRALRSVIDTLQIDNL